MPWSASAWLIAGHDRQREAAVGVVGQEPDGEAALGEQAAGEGIGPKADVRGHALDAGAGLGARRPVSLSAFEAVATLTPAAFATSRIDPVGPRH